jgi:hypothetical protein
MTSSLPAGLPAPDTNIPSTTGTSIPSASPDAP